MPKSGMPENSQSGKTKKLSSETTCWHLGLEELEDGGNVLVHSRVSQCLALPEGGEGEKSEHNPGRSSSGFVHLVKNNPMQEG